MTFKLHPIGAILIFESIYQYYKRMYYRALLLSLHRFLLLVVKAQYDALIAFDSDENDSDLYEIVIGGWGNSLSMVRRGKQGPNLGTGTVNAGSSPGQRGWTEVEILIRYLLSLQKKMFSDS